MSGSNPFGYSETNACIEAFKLEQINNVFRKISSKCWRSMSRTGAAVFPLTAYTKFGIVRGNRIVSVLIELSDSLYVDMFTRKTDFGEIYFPTED